MSTPSVVQLKNRRIFKQVDNTIQVVDNLPKRVYTMEYDLDREVIRE